MRARLLAAIVTTLVSVPVAQSAAAPAVSSFADRALRLPTAFSPPGFTGGEYTAATGETVHVFSAPAYSGDPSFNQAWADYLASLPHGTELSRLTVYFAPLSQVQSVCGASTLGCYSPDDEVIFTTGEDVAGVATAKDVVTHEYGHHIANNRDDSPWLAGDYGTKRWSSYVNVCSRARAGGLFPGDEGDHYKLNSGELFAETYRVYATRKLGLPEAPWGAVDAGLYPDEQALRLIEQDVLNPWTGPTVSSHASSFRPYTGTARRFRFATPLDGILALSLQAPAGSAYDVRVYDSTGTKLISHTTAGARPLKTVRYAICGERSLQVKVVESKGFGPFTLQISKP